MYQMYGNQDGMNPFDGQDDDNNQVSDYNDNNMSPFQNFNGYEQETPQGDGGIDVENGMNGQMNGQMMNGQMNGQMMDHGQDFTPEKKLQLAERANEIYRQQLRYMQDHLASLRSLIQDKEYVIENLMLRFDLGILQEDPARANSSLNGDEINQQELVRKAEALAQRTILENFELREMVNELRDENFHLRNEIYELQDRINRQVLHINKLEKTHTEDEDEFMDDDDETATEDQMDDGDAPQPDDRANTEQAQAIREQRARKHNRRQSSNVPPDIYNQNQPSESDEDEEVDPSNTEQAKAKRAQRAAKRQHRKQQSSAAVPKGMWNVDGDNESDADSENSEDNNNDENGQPDYANTEQAKAIREQRERKAQHRKNKSSIAPPKDIFEAPAPDSEGSSDDDEQGTKRRGSQVVEPTDPRFTDAAVSKREARQEKHHRRESSGAQPNIWQDDYSPEKGARDAKNRMKKYAPEAKEIREQRKKKAEQNLMDIADKKRHHKRKSSAHFRQLLEDGNTMLNPNEQREKEAARRKSVMNHLENIGKGHLSDEDINPKSRDKRKADKPQRKDRYDYSGNPKQRKKSVAMANATDLAGADTNVMPNVDELAKGKPSVNTNAKVIHHRRDSSNPVPDLGLEDPEVLLHWEKLRVKDLREQITKVEKELKEQKSNISNELQSLQNAVTTKEEQLQEAYVAKGDLIEKTANEITRLTMIINSLLSIPKIRDIVELVITDSISQAKKNGLL